MGELLNHLGAESLLTSAEVAKLLQVDATSIINWSKKGYLQYYRTPGGHRRIRAADVVAFLKQRSMPIPPTLTGIDDKRLMIVETDAARLKALTKEFDEHISVDKRYLGSVVEALLEVAHFRPSLMLLDAGVPDALEIVAQVKKRGVEVMLMSHGTGKDEEKKAQDAGALGVLAWPVSVGPVLNQLGLVERA